MLDLKLLQELDAYIEENYLEDKYICYDCMLTPSQQCEKVTQKESAKLYLKPANWPEFIPEPDADTFSTKLFHIIDRKGLDDVAVYKKANLDRKLFSKLRRPSYHPSKKTAIALALALELNLDEATDLLSYAEYALSPHELTDVIIKFCFEKPVYDIAKINELLYERTGSTL